MQPNEHLNPTIRDILHTSLGIKDTPMPTSDDLAEIKEQRDNLLEACKALLALVPRNKLHPFGYTDDPQDKANDLAREAIARAEGAHAA